MPLTLGHICGINVLESNVTTSAHSQGPELSIHWQRTYPNSREGREQGSCTAVGPGGLASVVCPSIVFSPATHARRCNPAQAQCLLAATQARPRDIRCFVHLSLLAPSLHRSLPVRPWLVVHSAAFEATKLTCELPLRGIDAQTATRSL